MQIVHSSRKGARSIEHIGSAHDDAELAVLKEVARQRLNAGQLSVDLPGLSGMNVAGSGPQAPAGAECVASITFKRMGVLLEALETAWKAVGLDRLDGADEVFRQLVTARLIEPSSKQDSSRVVADAGMINAATRPSTTATAPTEPDAPYAGSTPRSPRPRKPSQERSPSNATASCTCPVPPATATWRKGPAPWPGGKATSPTEAHLTIVTAALAMARRLETITGWSIKRLISTAFQDGCRLAVDIPYTPPSPQSGAKPAPRALRLRAQTRQHLANLESDTP